MGKAMCLMLKTQNSAPVKQSVENKRVVNFGITENVTRHQFDGVDIVYTHYAQPDNVEDFCNNFFGDQVSKTARRIERLLYSAKGRILLVKLMQERPQ